MSTTTATPNKWIRSESCSPNTSEHTEYRFEVTGKKLTSFCYSGPRNFSFFDFEKALQVFNSTPEATIWMIKVKEYKRYYSEYSKKWYYNYFVDGSRMMMMRKGLKYMKALK